MSGAPDFNGHEHQAEDDAFVAGEAQLHCLNCEYVGALIPLGEVEHLAERIDPGEIVPEGECRECGALVPPVAS